MSSPTPTNSKSFLKLLKETHSWPCNYNFKFIGEIEDVNNVPTFFSDKATIARKKSKTGKYHSITVIDTMATPEEVISAYVRVYQKHPKLITL